VRPRKTHRSPAKQSRPRCCCTISASPCMPRLMSVWPSRSTPVLRRDHRSDFSGRDQRRWIRRGNADPTALGPAQRAAELVRYWTLGPEDLRTIVSRRRPHNRLGFAVQLCALRYPGRLLRPANKSPRAARHCRRPDRRRSRSARRLCVARADPLRAVRHAARCVRLPAAHTNGTKH
jgi:hypothetical protein